MEINIVGIGMGNRALLTRQAEETILSADLLVGAQRMLDSFPELSTKKMQAATPEEIAQILLTQPPHSKQISVLVSGDTGFYSAAKKLPILLPGKDIRFFCGISSLQYFCACLGIGWEDAAVISMHGRDEDIVGTVHRREKVFILTDGTNSPKNLCTLLTEYGFGHCSAAVGTKLSYPDEKLYRGDVRELSTQEFPAPAVLMVWNPAAAAPVSFGILDAEFVRGETPMTKAEVRWISLAKLSLSKGEILWDVGAGTGSIGIEAARILENGTVYAVEKDLTALTLLEQNKARFACHNLQIVAGKAPQSLENLPSPDAVFVGGSSGNLKDILGIALQKNNHVRIVVNAIALETLSTTLSAFKTLGLVNVEYVQVAISKATRAGPYHMMIGLNPVFVLSGRGAL